VNKAVKDVFYIFIIIMLNDKDSKHNFFSFIVHALFLALAHSFIDVDVILPSMIIELGGNSMHVGLLTAIMLGGASVTQLVFAPFISNKSYKKKFLLLGINARILSLAAIGFLLYYISDNKEQDLLWLIFLVITIFAVGGAFANLSYNDIMGKSVNETARKKFFSVKQIAVGSGIFISAYFAKKILAINDYPYNYMYLFFIGFILLGVASGGFWAIREKVPSKLQVKGFKHFISIMKAELIENKKLKYYLGFVNTQGVSVAFLPFIILYSKEFLAEGNAEIGNFLIFKVIGAVSAGIVISILVKKIKYKYLMYINAFISLLMPFLMMMSNSIEAFYVVFFFGGVIISMYSITMNGVLLEVSNKDNRALYTGISGFGYILPAIFPILSGWLIKEFSFYEFFSLFIVIILGTMFFINKLNCQK